MKVAVIFGTRPEVIKVAAIVNALKARPDVTPLLICTGQHRELVAPLFDWFDFQPDRDLALMQPGQTPQGLLARALPALDRVLAEEEPDVVLVQGDTSTALAGALAGFHRKIPIGHIEAGLRTHELYSPFPEEANRTLISRICTWHFAPTARSAEALRAEKVPGEVFQVGNTVVDALLDTAKRLPPATAGERRMVLITAHRRESFGQAMEQALTAIRELSIQYADTDFVYPVHRNPAVFDLARNVLGGLSNVRLSEPMTYPDMVDHIRRSYLILSDSGGIQEEAPSFGVPILIMRESTERPEVVEAGIGELVGTDPKKIKARASFYLDSPEARAAVAAIPNPFGNGRSANRILDIIQKTPYARPH